MPTKTKVLKVQGQDKLQIHYVSISTLVHPSYNPRFIDDEDFEQLKKSLTNFEAVEPAVVNTHIGRENVIVGGNQRIRAAKALGWTEFPVIYVNLDEKRERELNVRLNRNTGLFDYQILAKEFEPDELKAWGFIDQEIEQIKSLRTDVDLRGDDEGRTVDKEKPVEKVEIDEPDTVQVYCPLWQHTDIGRSTCGHRCLYCYTAATPAGLQRDPSSYKITSKESLMKSVRDALARHTALTIGICNDPSRPEFRERLIYTLLAASRMKLYLIVQTKNPAAIARAIEECNANTERISVRASFSLHSDEQSRLIEPGAPVWSERIKGLNECAKLGCDVILGFAPFLVDYYEGMETTIRQVPAATRVTAEPLNMHRPGMGYFKRLDPIFTKDNKSVDSYIRRTQDVATPIYGALHWHRYNHDVLAQAYKTVKSIVTNAKRKFGVCSCSAGVEYMDMNEGDFCCQTPRMIEHGVKWDEHALAAIKDLSVYRIPLLDKLKEVNDKDYRLLLLRTSYVNDPMFKITFNKRS